MIRRSFLKLPLLGALPAFGAHSPQPDMVDALLIGDSHAYQLGPRLQREAKARGKTLAVRAQGGTSARQWVSKGWFRRAVTDHPARVVLAALGTNCVKQERQRLGEDFATLASIAPGLEVLYPPTRAFDVSYIAHAVHDAFDDHAAISLVMVGDLELQSDRVHATDRGLRRWAEVLAEVLWP